MSLKEVKSMKTEFLLLNSTPYENGKKSGEFFRNHVDLKQIELPVLTDKKNEMCSKLLHKLKNEYPDYYEEVRGKADGLDIDLLTYFSLLCPELFHLTYEHCTTIIAKKDNGHFILSHNEDDKYLDGNFCLSKVYVDNENWFVTNDMVNMPFGNGISYNSYGIIKSINYTHEENYTLEDLPRYFGQRHISEARSLDDLIERCRQMNTASGFHVNAIDINTHKAVSIEVYNHSISVIEIHDYYVHTNHYIHHDHAQHPVTDSGSNSIFRLNKASELMKDAERTVSSIKEILRYRSPENAHMTTIFQTKDDPSLTLFNFTYDTEFKDELLLDVYVTNEQLTLKYNNA